MGGRKTSRVMIGVRRMLEVCTAQVAAAASRVARNETGQPMIWLVRVESHIVTDCRWYRLAA